MNANLFAVFAGSASRTPDRIFLEAENQRLSYGEMLDQVAHIAGALSRLALTPGDRILVQVEKSPLALLLYLACLRAGVVFIPLNTAYTRQEVGYFLEDAQPALFICSAVMAEQIGDAPCRILTLEADGSGSLGDRLAHSDAHPPIADRSVYDVAAILYTSGTTGRSKGALITHGNLHSNVEVLNRVWAWQDDDVLIHALPIFHAHGLFVAVHCAMLGTSTILFHAGFRLDLVLRDLPRASVLMGVPTFYHRLMQHDALTADLVGHMRLFISGSAPLTALASDAFAARTGHRILERYGMTEALMIASNPYVGERIAGTVGFPLPGVTARIESGGQGPGVLEIKGPNVFQGYWRQPDKTAQAFTPDGFFRTGDIATVDPDGRITLVGRSSDMIISGGFNVYPKEVELVLDTLAEIEEAAVIGVPHPEFGEAVLAVVVRTSSDTADDVDLSHLSTGLAKQLASFKRPKRIIGTFALPRNAMGKVEKKILRERYADLFKP